MIFVYRIFLGVPGILAFWFGVAYIMEARTAMQETVGLLGILVGAVFITGYIIVESIHTQIRNQQHNHKRHSSLSYFDYFISNQLFKFIIIYFFKMIPN